MTEECRLKCDYAGIVGKSCFGGFRCFQVSCLLKIRDNTAPVEVEIIGYSSVIMKNNSQRQRHCFASV